MSAQYVVGIDGGNTKTIAVVATTAGRVLASATGTCSDIYGALSAQKALDELTGVVQEALAKANLSPAEVAATVASLAGADYPEDYVLYRTELEERAGLSAPVRVVNDGVGPVRLADLSGTGVAVVLGTGAAVGARGPGGQIWHGSFWLPVGGAAWLGSRALEAVYRAALDLGPPTSLTAKLLALFGVSDVEAMLHALTRRGSSLEGTGPARQAGLVLLDEDGNGDDVARHIVSEYARQVAPFAIIAAQKVAIRSGYNVVLTGGLLRHRSSTLSRTLAGAITGLDKNASASATTVAPVAGAVLEAIALTGTEISPALAEAIVSSGPFAWEGPLLNASRQH